MNTQVHKWGENLAVSIPIDLATQACLSEGMEVEITVADGKVIITPPAKLYSLDDLLAEVTPENLHDEIDTGNSVGQEIW